MPMLPSFPPGRQGEEAPSSISNTLSLIHAEVAPHSVGAAGESLEVSEPIEARRNTGRLWQVEHWRGVDSPNAPLRGWPSLPSAHGLGRGGSLGNREGKALPRARGPLGSRTPDTVGAGGRRPGWGCPGRAWQSPGSSKAGQQQEAKFTEAHCRSCFCFSYA